MFGYPAYQPTAFFPHEPKTKVEHHKTSQQSGLIVTKSGSAVERERETLPNPPPLMSELKNSVIVKHDGKNSHLLENRIPISHSQSPKLRPADMMSHYITATSQGHKTNMYEYRSPTQSPHHLSHTPSPHHHLEAQNLGKVSHHRSSSQAPSPHHQRQSPHPHAQQHPSPELRYRTSSEAQQMIFASAAKPGYAYAPQSTTTVAHYSHSPGAVSNSKPKVSSPAPHHIYGKPLPGIGSGIPVTRPMESVTIANPIPLTSKPPLTSSVSPSPYQQMSQYHSPHPQSVPLKDYQPPPAHSSRTTTNAERPTMYGMYPGGLGLSIKPSVQHGTSPPTAASAPSPVSRSHPHYSHPGVTQSPQNLQPSVQTQPLDLGVSSNKYDSASSPKRKGTPVSGAPVCLEKKRKIEQSVPSPQQQPLHLYGANMQPQLARVSEPSPLIASAATTITAVVNAAAYRPPATSLSQTSLADTLPDVSVTPVTVTSELQRPSSTEDSQPPILTVTTTATSSTPSPLNTTAQFNAESPSTPVKLAVTPSTVDSEKSNSPGPMKSTSGNYPVRHLKKAWLQRHTGEDVEDTTGVTGSGSCVTLPLNINSSSANKESSVTTLHNIGSMAVNSINKTKHFSTKTNNRKGNHKTNSPLNGHSADLSKGDDSSSSDQERGRKSPPKRKPPKVKRKKGGGNVKKVVDEQKRRKVGSNQSAPVSESGSESEKESGSDKDSDSGASTTLTSSKKPSSNLVNAKDSKEPRKRGRRPKTSKNDKGEEPRPKKLKDEVSLPQRDPFRKPPVGQLKKTGESFLQDGPCFEVAPKLGKCRECRWTPNQRTKNMPNIFCRFYAFRRLRYTKNGQLAIAGFSDPNKDALEVK